jgi:hypothetical protein
MTGGGVGYVRWDFTPYSPLFASLFKKGKGRVLKRLHSFILP